MKSHSALLARIFLSSASCKDGSVQSCNWCADNWPAMGERPCGCQKSNAGLAKIKCKHGNQIMPAIIKATSPAVIFFIRDFMSVSTSMSLEKLFQKSCLENL